MESFSRRTKPLEKSLEDHFNHPRTETETVQAALRLIRALGSLINGEKNQPAEFYGFLTADQRALTSEGLAFAVKHHFLPNENEVAGLLNVEGRSGPVEALEAKTRESFSRTAAIDPPAIQSSRGDLGAVL